IYGALSGLFEFFFFFLPGRCPSLIHSAPLGHLSTFSVKLDTNGQPADDTPRSFIGLLRNIALFS
ncbi:MAG: hypothetical protein D6814_08605, partial [Calditrichaeota bacterium]